MTKPRAPSTKRSQPVDEYTSALELQPDYPDAHVNLGLCLAEMGDHSGAIKAFRTASILDPDDMDALQELSATQIDVGEYAEAIRNLKHVVKKNPKNTDAWIDLGVAHTEQGFFAEAETAFRAACASDAKDALCAYHLAALYGAWERFPEALEKLADAILLDPPQVSEWAQSDRIFDPIRETPEFKNLLPST